MNQNLDVLWKHYKIHNCRESKEKIIIHYVSLVKVISGRLFSTYSAHIEFDDIVSYGIIGLIDAIEKFDGSKNVKFETYANFRIKGSIIDQIRSLDWIPRSKRQKFKSLDEAVFKLQNEYGDALTDEIIAKEMSISAGELNTLMGEMSSISVMSLDEKISENSNFTLKTDIVSDCPDKSYDEKETKEILGQIIEQLGEKEKLVISLYYFDELTYKEISEVLGISESRISQIHTKSILSIRNKMKNLITY